MHETLPNRPSLSGQRLWPWAFGGAHGIGGHRGQPAPGADETVWRNYVEGYQEQPDWSPKGTIIADSVSGHTPNGFSFSTPGYLTFNNAMFGSPLTGPRNLDADSMRSLMGNGMRGAQGLGTCTLTLAAQQWMASANDSMAGGHCFGFASTAAELFTGMLQVPRFQPGIQQTYDLALRAPISRQIARNMASQYAMNVMDSPHQPQARGRVAQALLSPGSTPHTLFILWGGGGHAVTPVCRVRQG